MPKIVTTPQSVLFQLGVLQPRTTSRSRRPTIQLANVHAVDTYTKASDEKPKTSAIDWEQRILHANNHEEALAAIEEAGRLKDARSVEAIVRSTIANYITDYDAIHKNLKAVKSSIISIGHETIPILIQIIEAHGDSSLARKSVELMDDLTDAGIVCLRAIPALVRFVETTTSLVHTEYTFDILLATGDQKTIKWLRTFYQDNRELHENAPIRESLVHNGVVTWDQLLALEGWSPGGTLAIEHLTSPLHRAIYDFLTHTRRPKHAVFGNSTLIDTLPDRQAWITINDPQLAKDLVAAVQAKAGKRRGTLDKLLFAAVGARSKDLVDDHYTYYADEIIDSVAQFVQNSPLKNVPEIAALISQIRYGDDIKLRYIRREESDLKLGDKCGDCTATGSIHFGDSTTWLINPAYQILTMAKGKRFIGKINFTMGTLAGEDGIIIDAIEFNPQAQKGKPYHDDAIACFKEAMAFLKGLARRQNRALFGLTTSNSSGAVQMLNQWGEVVVIEDGTSIMIKLLIPSDDIANTLKKAGYKGELSLHYQMIGTVKTSQEQARDLSDERLPQLENEVINPAQMADENVAAAMRDRDFETASKLILANATWASQTKAIFGFPADIALSPTFLVKKLEKIYADEALSMDDLKRAFMVDGSNFVRIPT